MAQFYHILKADKFGDTWTPNAPDAKPIQNYWCQVEGEDWAVSIGKQVPNTVTAGEHLYGDLLKARSQKGTDYWKFKSAQVPEGVQRPASSPAQAQAQQAVNQPVDMSATQPAWFAPWGNMITYIYNEMKKMDSDPEPSTPEPTQPEQVEISDEDKSILDDIFSKPIAPATTPEDK